jgi:ring-1,2-phenylacetyl-CoA epoxidase subunit PaaD
MVTTISTPIATTEQLWNTLAGVMDPEVPVLSILDLGIVRHAELREGKAYITITPTYSGCPAMNAIAVDIRLKLMAEGLREVQITTQLSPAWTTDWMSAQGRAKLLEYGIVPPAEPLAGADRPFAEEAIVRCPRCNSVHTELISRFGSTACKALYRCTACGEPFDYFKCHR